MRYQYLTKRNELIISKNLQDKIKKCKIFVLGCGLGTQIALLATRMGFRKFILIDGDKVEDSNMNRQAFRYKHRGQNKAKALATMIKDINPKASVEYYTEYLKDEKLAKKLVDKSDAVINMADPNEIMYYVNNYAQGKGKIVFFPLNLIWGGYVLVFTKKSKKMSDVVGSEEIYGNEFYMSLLKNTFSTFPKNLRSFYRRMGKKIEKQSYAPQVGTSVYLTSSIIISNLIKWLDRKPVKKAPNPIFLDAWEEK